MSNSTLVKFTNAAMAARCEYLETHKYTVWQVATIFWRGAFLEAGYDLPPIKFYRASLIDPKKLNIFMHCG